MKSPIPLTPGYLAFDPPEDSCDFSIINNGTVLQYDIPDHWLMAPVTIDLPTGHTYAILGWSNEIGEDVAKVIVEMHNDRFKDYEFSKNGITNYCFNTALESLATLLSSKGITGNCLIIKID